MDQILQNAEATISNTWYEDGDPVDPGAVTVDISAVDGTPVVTDGPVTGGGPAARSYTLSPEETAPLGALTVKWKSATQGIRTTYVEVVGGFYFAIAELTAEYSDLDDPAEYTPQKIAKARKAVEDLIERETHFAGVPRAKLFTFSGSDRRDLMIPVHYFRRVISGKIGADPLDLATVQLDGLGVYRDLTWPAGHRNVALLVEHGLDSPPEALREAAMLLAYHKLTGDPLDDRTTALQGNDGRIELLATPGRHGSITGIPDVDAAIVGEALSDPRSWLAIV